MEYFFTCPYCWEQISFILDSSVPAQEYVEDCEVCCNPINIRVHLSDGEVISFDAEKTQ